MSNLPDFFRGTAFRDMEKLFDDWNQWPVSLQKKMADLSQGFSPSCEVTENKEQYLLKFDLPGLTKDQIKVELHDNRLTVSGERKSEKKEETAKRHFSEVSYGSFLRTFTFPTPVDAERVEAKYDNGVLNLSIAKSDLAKIRQINIK